MNFSLFFYPKDFLGHRYLFFFSCTIVYLDVGRGSSDTATLAFTFSGTFSRYWDIKITQIPCDVTYELVYYNIDRLFEILTT